MSGYQPTGRELLIATPLRACLPALLLDGGASRSPIDTAETAVVLPLDVRFTTWGNLPPMSGEQATLYGDYNKRGPYPVLMRWWPGFFSAPHTYATDRIQVVVPGVWYVNSGPDFAPGQALPVPAGEFLLRRARTPHYDGVPDSETQPAVIAVFGERPVKQRLIDPSLPARRRKAPGSEHVMSDGRKVARAVRRPGFR